MSEHKIDNDVKYYKSLSEINPNLARQVKDLFLEVERLGLMVAEGSYSAKDRSRIVWTPFKVQFRDEQDSPSFDKKFNFGIFKPDGFFVNLSCEGDLGKKYSKDLADILSKDEVMKESGKVLITDLLSVKDAWLELIQKLLPELRDRELKN